MSVTRRDLLRGAAVLAGATAFGPVVGRGGVAWGHNHVTDPAVLRTRRRLVLIDLCGGNDGLNTVVPMTGTRRDDYDTVRTGTAVAAGSLRPLGYSGGEPEGLLGLHPELPVLHSLYTQNRVAVVQGAGYDDNNFSHFVAADIWQSGATTTTAQSGWLGRHLDRTGIADGELRALAMGNTLPLSLTGANQRGWQLASLPPSFPDGSAHVALHKEYARYGDGGYSGLRARYADSCGDAAELVTRTSTMTTPAGSWPSVVGGMLGAREVLSADALGVEIVTVKHNGFDTHAHQNTAHPLLLRQLDRAIEAFWFGTFDGVAITKNGVPLGPLPQHVAERTVVMTFSEFGRRIADNGSGTDHGAAQPLLLVGPAAPVAGVPALVAGLHGDHPPLAGVANLETTVDFRRVYQSILGTWLSQPSDGAYQDGGDPGFKDSSGNPITALPGLFA